MDSNLPTQQEQRKSVNLNRLQPNYSKELFSITEILKSGLDNVAVIRKENGEQCVKAFLVYQISDLVEFMNLGKSMNTNQIGQTTELILQDFYYLKPEDFVLCFNNAKKGLYGKQYDRIDGQVIMLWLTDYATERAGYAESINSQKPVEVKVPIDYAKVQENYKKRLIEGDVVKSNKEKEYFRFKEEYKNNNLNK